jgi:hypothetical protein
MTFLFESNNNNTDRCLISILWLVNGMQNLLDIRKGTTYNIAFFIDVVTPSLIENIMSRSRRKILKGCVIRMDSTCLHNSRLSQECVRASKAERLWHSAYGMNTAPSDFFLFGHVKEKMSEYNSACQPDALKTIAKMFSQTGEVILISVFKSWIKWLQWVIQHEGEYYIKSRDTKTKYFFETDGKDCSI